LTAVPVQPERDPLFADEEPIVISRPAGIESAAAALGPGKAAVRNLALRAYKAT
jgi:hypothetical protein